MSERDIHELPQTTTFGRMLLVVLAVLAGFLVWKFWASRSPINPEAEPRAVTARGDLAEDEKSTIAIFRSASLSVVHITTVAVRRDMFNLNMSQIQQGTGSGVVWDTEGHIVTNFHVIQGARAAQVTLADHSTWNAKLVGGGFPDKDIAVLWIDAPKSRLHPIVIGTSQDLQVGQKVLAIGNPFGLDQSLTTGVISALGREIESVNNRPINDVIQIDAAINPGNSGGPLLDSAGRLIGLNTAIASPSGAYAGIGFAIPVDEINRVVTDMIRFGQVVRPGLGITPVPDPSAQEMHIQGVLIMNVQPEGAAAKAGLRPTRRNADGDLELGDIITAIDDTRVATSKDLYRALANYRVGQTITVTIIRDGKPMTVEVTLENLK